MAVARCVRCGERMEYETLLVITDGGHVMHAGCANQLPDRDQLNLPYDPAELWEGNR